MENWQYTLQAQFSNSPRLRMILEGFNQAVDPSSIIDAWYDAVFNPQTAVGFGLDIWGRIVGVSRVVKLTAADYFGFSQQVPGVTTYGFGIFYNGSDPVTSNFSLDDDIYRRLVFAKAAVNISDNSITSLNAILMALFPGRGRAYVKDNRNMTMEYVFEWSMTDVEKAVAISSGVLTAISGVSITYDTD